MMEVISQDNDNIRSKGSSSANPLYSNAIGGDGPFTEQGTSMYNIGT